MNRKENKIEIPRIEEFIKSLSEKELIYLNRLVIERLKLISQEKSTSQMMRFNIGERVSFTAPDGQRRQGFIIRLNKKTASIRTDDNENWNVAPGLLKNSPQQ
ncbi:MAG: hypothetical protein HPY53_02595 [Brevinematales bacterium]|nr:hypothetical protein [Brevinematales bacterium]